MEEKLPLGSFHLTVLFPAVATSQTAWLLITQLWFELSRLAEVGWLLLPVSGTLKNIAGHCSALLQMLDVRGGGT